MWLSLLYASVCLRRASPRLRPTHLAAVVDAMGRGRNRKPRNFATFRLCPRPGAADASDRVFVRVDDNPYGTAGVAQRDRKITGGR